MFDVFDCLVCGNMFAESEVVAYSRKNMTCLCRKCATSDIVQSAHYKHMSVFDFVSIVSDQDPDQED